MAAAKKKNSNNKVFTKDFQLENAYVLERILSLVRLPDFKFRERTKHTPVTISKEEWGELNYFVYNDHNWKKSIGAILDRWAWYLIVNYFKFTIVDDLDWTCDYEA
jgi:hypothetical protein